MDGTPGANLASVIRRARCRYNLAVRTTFAEVSQPLDSVIDMKTLLWGRGDGSDRPRRVCHREQHTSRRHSVLALDGRGQVRPFNHGRRIV